MKKVFAIHNRPNENDCYDWFVRWSREREYPLEMIHWKDFNPSVVTSQDKVAVFLQDPVPHNRLKNIPDTALNAFLNNADRRYAYPIWEQNDIICPPSPEPFDYFRLRKEQAFPYLIKDLTKQMGKGFVVDSVKRLDWLMTKSKKFDENDYWTLKFVDTKYSDGYYRLHRYLVCGDRAIPCRFAKTPQWNCKGSHMYEAKQWNQDELQKFISEYSLFWDAPVPSNVVKAVKLLDIDFALVDTSICERTGNQIFWEVNPYVNMFPNSSPGIQERWFPFFASYLYDIPYVDNPVDLEAFARQAIEFKGYKKHWTAKLKAA